MIETPRGVLNAAAIAGSGRTAGGLLDCFVAGLNDLRKETGVAPEPGRTYVVPFLMQVILAARAYGLFRAVAVPAGAHTIAWRYRPASYALGLLCAAPALALAGLGIGLGGRPRGGFSGRTRR